MKNGLLWSFFAIMLSMAICTSYLDKQIRRSSIDSPPMEIVFETQSAALGYDEKTMITLQTEDALLSLSLHDYLTGVLSAEVPTTFAEEAIKAQAVAARTFALKQIESGRHNGAVCSRSSCCQAWTDAHTDGMEKAVSATDGCVIEYDEQLIDAVFFSCSGGRTETAAAVWGGEVPYLQAVDSPGEEEAAPFSDSLSISVEEFRTQIEAIAPDAKLNRNPKSWVGSTIYTDGGGVATIIIGGIPIQGTKIRSTFGLRSTIFSIEATENEIIFHTLGYGHRVGMSQYGADAMANNGADFRTILQYYYQNVTINERK